MQDFYHRNENDPADLQCRFQFIRTWFECISSTTVDFIGEETCHKVTRDLSSVADVDSGITRGATCRCKKPMNYTRLIHRKRVSVGSR